MDVTLPEIEEKAKKDKGVVMHEDEASFKVSGSLSRSWYEIGQKKGAEVNSKPSRESVKAFGATSVGRNPRFHFLFADVFNARTFKKFLKQLVRQYEVKIHLILDNARYHHACLLQDWLKENSDKIELHFLPAYSPHLNAQECVWRITRRKSTHNRFFENKEQLKKTVFRRFNRFQGNPASLRNIMAPFLHNASNDGINYAG